MNKNPANIWRKSQKLSAGMGQLGKILTFTTIFAAPSDFEHQTPYVVGIIQFPDKETIAAEIVDCSENSLGIGMKVQTVVRRVGQSEPEELIEYGIKVKPLK